MGTCLAMVDPLTCKYVYTVRSTVVICLPGALSCASPGALGNSQKQCNVPSRSPGNPVIAATGKI